MLRATKDPQGMQPQKELKVQLAIKDQLDLAVTLVLKELKVLKDHKVE